MQRIEITFVGLVQGVGFRMSAASAARASGVVGWVRNEPDGSVRMVVEGNADRIDACLERIRRCLGDNIREERHTPSAATGEFSSFEIMR